MGILYRKPNPDVILIVELEELLDQSHPIGEALFNHAIQKS